MEYTMRYKIGRNGHMTRALDGVKSDSDAIQAVDAFLRRQTTAWAKLQMPNGGKYLAWVKDGRLYSQSELPLNTEKS